MWAQIIAGVFKLLFGWISKEHAESKESEAEMLKARAESVEDSYKEEAAVKDNVIEAKEKAEKEGNADDVFGADSYNS